MNFVVRGNYKFSKVMGLKRSCVFVTPGTLANQPAKVNIFVREPKLFWRYGQRHDLVKLTIEPLNVVELNYLAITAFILSLEDYSTFCVSTPLNTSHLWVLTREEVTSIIYHLGLNQFEGWHYINTDEIDACIEQIILNESAAERFPLVVGNGSSADSAVFYIPKRMALGLQLPQIGLWPSWKPILCIPSSAFTSSLQASIEKSLTGSWLFWF